MKKFVVLLLVLAACGQKQALYLQDMAPLMVYQTKKDYSQYVPVQYSEKAGIVSFPGPMDLQGAKGLHFPVKLKEGYWLDNIGIGPNVAYLDIKIEDYIQLTEAPGLDFLTQHIQDKAPLISMYHLGNVGSVPNPVETINTWIKEGKLAEHGQKVY